jgi:arsenate reductase (thioredoxin)
MRLLTSAIATLALVWGISSAADEASTKQVVFVCEHGNVKSFMAASYFNKLAAQRRLPWRAVARGSAPDSLTVPKPIAEALRAEGIDASVFRPAKIDAADVADAARIVTIGTDLPLGVRGEEQRIERWNDVPPASTSYDAARSSLKAHIAELLDRLSLQAGGQPDRRN